MRNNQLKELIPSTSAEESEWVTYNILELKTLEKEGFKMNFTQENNLKRINRRKRTQEDVMKPSTWRVETLRNILKKHDLSCKGNKAELVRRATDNNLNLKKQRLN